MTDGVKRYGNCPNHGIVEVAPHDGAFRWRCPEDVERADCAIVTFPEPLTLADLRDRAKAGTLEGAWLRFAVERALVAWDRICPGAADGCIARRRKIVKVPLWLDCAISHDAADAQPREKPGRRGAAMVARAGKAQRDPARDGFDSRRLHFRCNRRDYAGAVIHRDDCAHVRREHVPRWIGGEVEQVVSFGSVTLALPELGDGKCWAVERAETKRARRLASFDVEDPHPRDKHADPRTKKAWLDSVADAKRER